MNAEAPSAAKVSPEKRWWLRALAVFQSPRPVFAALRDDSEREAEARQEPVLALVVLAGIAGILLAPESGRLLDEDLVDGSIPVLSVLVFLTGSVYGFATYWLGGAALYAGLRGAGSKASYRRARHVLAFAAAPLALGLVLVWPARLLIHRADTFESGGADEGAAGAFFDAASGAFALWAFALLVYGIAVVERWRPLRALVSLGLALLTILILAFPFVLSLSAS